MLVACGDLAAGGRRCGQRESRGARRDESLRDESERLEFGLCGMRRATRGRGWVGPRKRAWAESEVWQLNTGTNRGNIPG